MGFSPSDLKAMEIEEVLFWAGQLERIAKEFKKHQG